VARLLSKRKAGLLVVATLIADRRVVKPDSADRGSHENGKQTARPANCRRHGLRASRNGKRDSGNEPGFPPPRNNDDPPLTETAKNGKLREQRKKLLREAEAATRYWRVRMDFESAVSIAQARGIPEGSYHPDVGLKDLRLVDRWREALVKQLLTPAPDLLSVAWKKAALAQGQYRYAGVSAERIERAIAEDLAFLAAHPIRHKNSEAIAAEDRSQGT
jgi:hypothetical protein